MWLPGSYAATARWGQSLAEGELPPPPPSVALFWDLNPQGVGNIQANNHHARNGALATVIGVHGGLMEGSPTRGVDETIPPHVVTQ